MKKKITNKKHSDNGIIFVLFLFMFSLGLRLIYMNPGLFEVDSIGLASAIEETYKTGILHGLFNGRYGSVIVNLITYVPYHLISGIDSAEKSIIFTEILFASFSVIILFLLIKKIFNNNFIASVGALIFSISPIFLSVTTYGDSIGLEIFFILTAFYLLACFHKNNSQLYIALSSSFIAFSIMVRESALVFVPLYFLFYLNPVIRYNRNFIFLKEEIFKTRNLIAVLTPFLLIFGIYTHYVFYNIVYRTLFIPDDGSGSVVKFLGLLSSMLSASMEDLYTNLSIVGIILAIGGIIIFFKLFENKFYFIFFLIWAGTFFYFGNTSTYSPYYLAIVSIPFYIFISIFLNYLFKINKLIGIAGLSLLIFMLFSQIQPILDYRHNFSGEKECALWVKDEIPPDSELIAMNDAPFFNYYANLKTISHPIGDTEATETWTKDINSLLKNGSKIYIIDSAFTYDPGFIFLNALYLNFDIEDIESHICEDYHKATLIDNRYKTVLSKVNRIITPKELGIAYNWSFTKIGDRILFSFTNTEDRIIKNTKLKIETVVKGQYSYKLYSIGDVNAGETKEIDIDQAYINPMKIMVWREDLNSWILLYRGEIICGESGCSSSAYHNF